MTYIPIFVIVFLFFTVVGSPLGAIVIRASCRFARRTNEQGVEFVDGEDELVDTELENSVAPADFDEENPYANSSAARGSTLQRNQRGVPTIPHALIISVTSSFFFFFGVFGTILVLENLLPPSIPNIGYYGAIFLIYIASCVVKSFTLAKFTQQTMPITLGPIILDQAIWFGICTSLCIFFGIICTI